MLELLLDGPFGVGLAFAWALSLAFAGHDVRARHRALVRGHAPCAAQGVASLSQPVEDGGGDGEVLHGDAGEVGDRDLFV